MESVRIADVDAANPRHLNALLAFEERSLTGTDVYWGRNLSNMIARHSPAFVYAASACSTPSSNARVLGYVLCWVLGAKFSTEGSTIHVAKLVVDPLHRRRGIGRQLMRASIDRAKNCGAASLTLMVAIENSAARALYASLGFEDERVVHGYYGSGRHAMKMRLRF